MQIHKITLHFTFVIQNNICKYKDNLFFIHLYIRKQAFFYEYQLDRLLFQDNKELLYILIVKHWFLNTNHYYKYQNTLFSR